MRIDNVLEQILTNNYSCCTPFHTLFEMLSCGEVSQLKEKVKLLSKLKHRYDAELSNVKNEQSFLIHDNGDRPFRVNVFSDYVEVCTATYCEGPEDVRWGCEQPFKVFIPPPEMKVIDVGMSERGNTILVQPTEELKYVYIGKSIMEFSTTSPIRVYKSPIGRNDVPYPFGISDTHVYLIVESICIERTNIEDDLVERFERGLQSPYRLFYENKSLGSPLKVQKVYPSIR